MYHFFPLMASDYFLLILLRLYLLNCCLLHSMLTYFIISWYGSHHRICWNWPLMNYLYSFTVKCRTIHKKILNNLAQDVCFIPFSLKFYIFSQLFERMFSRQRRDHVQDIMRPICLVWAQLIWTIIYHRNFLTIASQIHYKLTFFLNI